MSKPLTKFQKAALLNLYNKDDILISSIPDFNEKDEFDNVVPGITVYVKLDEIGLVLITEEDPFLFEGEDADFEFTPSVCLTDKGRMIAQSI